MSAGSDLLAGLRAFRRQVETRVLGALRERMDAAVVRAPALAPPPPALESPAQLLDALLQRSTEQTRAQGEQALYLAILAELLPDEARILAALSDGTTYPLIHLDAGPWIGAPTRRVVANVCSVGKSAGVACPELTPSYVRRLLAQGLAESGPEDDAHETAYEILATDPAFRAAKPERQKTTVVRRVLQITDLGRALWAACRQNEA